MLLVFILGLSFNMVYHDLFYFDALPPDSLEYCNDISTLFGKDDPSELLNVVNLKTIDLNDSNKNIYIMNLNTEYKLNEQDFEIQSKPSLSDKIEVYGVINMSGAKVKQFMLESFNVRILERPDKIELIFSQVEKTMFTFDEGQFLGINNILISFFIRLIKPI